MSGTGDAVSLFTPEELAAMVAKATEAQREFDAYCQWLRSPEGKAWADQVLQEVRTMAVAFEADCASGKYTLTDDELDQLLQDAKALVEDVKAGREVS